MSDYTPFPVWPRPSDEGGGVTSHGALTGRNSASQHNGGAVDVAVAELFDGTLNEFAQQVLTSGGGGTPEVALCTVAISDDGDTLDLGDGSVGPLSGVLLFNRSPELDGVYDIDPVDGWVKRADQPTLVLAEQLIEAPTMDLWFDVDVWTLFGRGAGWQLVGAVPTPYGNPASVWGNRGWRTIPSSTFTYVTDGDGGYDLVGGPYLDRSARIFIGPDDPATAGFTLVDGDQWKDTSA